MPVRAHACAQRPPCSSVPRLCVGWRLFEMGVGGLFSGVINPISSGFCPMLRCCDSRTRQVASGRANSASVMGRVGGVSGVIGASGLEQTHKLSLSFEFHALKILLRGGDNGDLSVLC